MNATAGQVWRNVHGVHVFVGDIESYTPPGHHHAYDVLWVTPCTADGTPTGGIRIPMEPTFDSSSLWTHVGQVSS